MTALVSSMRSPPVTPLDAAALGNSSKRTFKDKLHGMIQDAEAAEVAAQRELQLQDKKSLALSLLLEGRPAAYVDFFHLTHGNAFTPNLTAPVPNGTAGPASTSAAGQAPAPPPSADGEELPQEVLGRLKQELVLADSAARQNDPKEVYAAYKALAKYFAQGGRLRTAEFFFKRCLALASAANWLTGELEAHLALGVVYEELRDTGAAIACHLRRLELSTQHKLTDELPTAYASLTAMFLHQAQVQEASGSPVDATLSYNRCIQTADQAGDVATAAKAHFRLGVLYFQAKKWQEAMHYLSTFIRLLPQTAGDSVAEGTAHTTYAQCLTEVGDVEGAMVALEEYLDGSAGRRDAQGSATACCSLGILYYQQQRFERAVLYLERFYEMARTFPDRKALEVARVNLGVARGAVRMAQYMKLVDADLVALIQWKNARVPFSNT